MISQGDIVPETTILICGAGAAIPSGGPSSSDLIEAIHASVGGPKPNSLTLMEYATFVEESFGRQALIDAVRARLKNINPVGAALALPQYKWKALYTTNFDQLIEKSFARSNRALTVVRSNFDISRASQDLTTPLFKIHGCLTEDIAYGHLGRMVLTDKDYRAVTTYREMIFARLRDQLFNSDCIIVGHSLRDQHLKELVDEVVRIHREIGSLRRLHITVQEADEIRAAILQSQGAKLIQGGIDELARRVTMSQAAEVISDRISISGAITIPASLATSTTVVSDLAINREQDPTQLFNGRPASYDDVASGNTFERNVEKNIIKLLTETSTIRYVTVEGTFGVGKTTLLRRLAFQLAQMEKVCLEHNSEFPFSANDWLAFDALLQENKTSAILFIDDVQEHSREIKSFADRAQELQGTAGLRLVFAAHQHEWAPIIKSRQLFQQGTSIHLRQLATSDIDRLLSLSETNARVRNLVDSDFGVRGKTSKRAVLQNKCRRDMYVCLKNIFSNTGLDKLILLEYERLPPELQEIYKTVAALESLGCQVHRQMIIRLLNLIPNQIGAILDQLDGIIFEYDVTEENKAGTYRWNTRHAVIASTIQKYKYAEQQKLLDLLSDIVANANPTYRIELRTLRSICSVERGITALRSYEERKKLYLAIIDLVPGERLPWQRYIQTLLEQDHLELAEAAVKNAYKVIGRDSTVWRYEIRLMLKQAQKLSQISSEDFYAGLLLAREEAQKFLVSRPDNKHGYVVAADVEFEIASLTKDCSELDATLDGLYAAYERLLDPWIEQRHRDLESRRMRQFSQARRRGD